MSSLSQASSVRTLPQSRSRYLIRVGFAVKHFRDIKEVKKKRSIVQRYLYNTMLQNGNDNVFRECVAIIIFIILGNSRAEYRGKLVILVAWHYRFGKEFALKVNKYI
jgi:hypothetical protein